MNCSNVKIRIAAPEDAERLLAIYAPYVRGTAITFEYDVPSLEEFTGRIRNTLKGYPYLVAELDGQILGYAYAGHFQTRAAYDWAAETSIYVDRNARKMGVGKKLHQALELALKKQGILNMYACNACQEKEDEYRT